MRTGTGWLRSSACEHLGQNISFGDSRILPRFSEILSTILSAAAILELSPKVGDGLICQAAAVAV
jgi:hypothetical protein